MALSSVLGVVLEENLVLGPSLGCVVGCREDVVVPLDDEGSWFRRPGGLPRGRPLLLVVVGGGFRFVIWLSGSALHSCCSVVRRGSVSSFGSFVR